MNGINAVNAVSGIKNIFETDSINKTVKTDSDVSFRSIFEELLETANVSDNTDKMANLGLLTGELDNIHDVVIAGEEADLALRLTMSIRNKALDAYNEIMRMQV